MTSAERRVTVQASLYPRLKEWANRDGITVADVVNAILLQTIRPYAVPMILSGYHHMPSDCVEGLEVTPSGSQRTTAPAKNEIRHNVPSLPDHPNSTKR